MLDRNRELSQYNAIILRPNNPFGPQPPAKPDEIKQVDCSFCGEIMGAAVVRNHQIVYSVSPKASDMTSCEAHPTGTHARDLEKIGVVQPQHPTT